MGPKDLGTPANFISSPRPMLRRKKWAGEMGSLEMEQKESRLPRYTAKDDLILGRPKS